MFINTISLKAGVLASPTRFPFLGKQISIVQRFLYRIFSIPTKIKPFDVGDRRSSDSLFNLIQLQVKPLSIYIYMTTP